MPGLKTASISVQNVFGCLTALKRYYFNFLPGKLVFPVLKCLLAEADSISAFWIVAASSVICVLALEGRNVFC